jgi:hypothetical protein
MIDRATDPRTEDVIVYDLLRTPSGGADGEPIGTATFRQGRVSVDAPDEVEVAVSELLARSFVDRLQADERPRGYRRSGQGRVDMLVPGMPEHFIARLQGLWLPYPDGSVVTARPAVTVGGSAAGVPAADVSEASPPVTDPAVRRMTLDQSTEILNVRPLVAANDPVSGARPTTDRPAARTDCGWIT